MAAHGWWDDAFVLRTYKLGEADLIIVLLTREHGLVRAVAKGARRTKSRFGARLDRFTRVTVQVYAGRSLGRITDAHTAQTYAPPIVTDPDKFFAGAAMLEMAGHFGDDPGAGEHIFDLLDRGMRQLAEEEFAPVTAADVFVLSCLEVAGLAPSLVDCSQCGKAGPHRAFHPAAGGAVCVTCRPPGSLTPEPQSVRALWLLANGRYRQAVEVLSDDEVQRVAHRLLVAHVRHHLSVGCPAFAAL